METCELPKEEVYTADALLRYLTYAPALRYVAEVLRACNIYKEEDHDIQDNNTN